MFHSIISRATPSRVLRSDMRAAAYVLTGGNSTRMGRDKALLPFGKNQLVQSIAGLLSQVVPLVYLVGQPQRYGHLPWPCLPDLRAQLGPLAGLEAALSHSQSDLNLIVACDMPGLRVDSLVALIERSRNSEALCVAASDHQNRVHPLCAVYKPACLPTVEKALSDGRLRLTDLLLELRAEYIHFDVGLDNVNTPLDWARWQAISLDAS